MTNVDQFESVFRSAGREPFEYRPPEVEKVLVVTDLDAGMAALFTSKIRDFLSVIGGGVEWETANGARFGNIGSLLELVEKTRPDIICTYRHLHSDAWKWPFSLGEYLDVMTQVMDCPVMVFPHPEREKDLKHAIANTDVVMAITDHVVGDHHLVNQGAFFTHRPGTLILANVEDQKTFDRYIGTIAKIPGIDTAQARNEIEARLLKDSRDFIGSCRDVLGAVDQTLKVEEIVTLGHRLSEYRRIIEEHQVDLLVMNTRDEDQCAMRGMAYPLAVDLRLIPLLML